MNQMQMSYFYSLNVVDSVSYCMRKCFVFNSVRDSVSCGCWSFLQLLFIYPLLLKMPIILGIYLNSTSQWCVFVELFKSANYLCVTSSSFLKQCTVLFAYLGSSCKFALVIFNYLSYFKCVFY